MATESTNQQVGIKFIGEKCVALDHGLITDVEDQKIIGEVSEENDGNNVVEKVYRASLCLKDYVTNIVIALMVQMSFTRNRVNGLSKIATKFIECDNNGIKSVVPHLDKGVSCRCRNGASSRCSMYKICKDRCPNAVYQESNGLPVVLESDEEKTLKDNQPIMEGINRKQSERGDNTRRIYSWYQRLLMEEFSSLIHGLVRAQKLSLSRLKWWIITMRPNLRSLNQEQDVEVILRSFYPAWYDTIWLSKLIERLEQHLKMDLEIKKSLLSFNSGVDHYFSKRAFLKGGSELVAVMSIDLEWKNYPAHDFHLIYDRAVRALEQVSNRTFTVLFCTVLKEYVIQHKINSAIIHIKEAVIEDIRHDHRFKSYTETDFMSSKDACSTNVASMLVVAKELGIPIPVKEGCGCALFEVHSESEPATLAPCYKPFNGCYGLGP